MAARFQHFKSIFNMIGVRVCNKDNHGSFCFLYFDEPIVVQLVRTETWGNVTSHFETKKYK